MVYLCWSILHPHHTKYQCRAGSSPGVQFLAKISTLINSWDAPPVSGRVKSTLSVHCARSFSFVLPSVELLTTPCSLTLLKPLLPKYLFAVRSPRMRWAQAWTTAPASLICLVVEVDFGGIVVDRTPELCVKNEKEIIIHVFLHIYLSEIEWHENDYEVLVYDDPDPILLKDDFSSLWLDLGLLRLEARWNGRIQGLLMKKAVSGAKNSAGLVRSRAKLPREGDA